MGKLGDKVCYICLKKNLEVLNLSENDEDQLTYKEKLNYCVPNVLEEFEDSTVCRECISLLRNAYKLITTVRSSLQYITNYEENINIDEKEVNDFESKFNCDNCRLSFESIKQLQNHYDRFHTNCPLYEDTNIISNKPIIFNTTNEFACKICKIKLKSDKLLQKHFISSHNENKSYECTVCEKKFKQSWHLHEHLSSHTGEKNHKCSVCEKRYLRASSLRRHLKGHQRRPGEKVKPTPFLCTVCGKKFVYSNGLQRHMRVHLGIKLHECDVCKRKFSQKTHLLAHTRTHTGEKPYVCETCGEAFTLNATLKKHSATHRRDGNVKIEFNYY